MTAFVMGCALTTAVFLFWRTFQVVDVGISDTYLNDELDTLRHESDVLKRMAEVYWLGLSIDAARTELDSLEVFDFQNGEKGLAAGPIFLVVGNGQVKEIQHHCARFRSIWCEQRGVN